MTICVFLNFSDVFLVILMINYRDDIFRVVYTSLFIINIG